MSPSLLLLLFAYLIIIIIKLEAFIIECIIHFVLKCFWTVHRWQNEDTFFLKDPINKCQRCYKFLFMIESTMDLKIGVFLFQRLLKNC